MTNRVDPGVLWARAVILGTVTTFLGIVGHVTADGLLPGTPLLVVLFGFTVLLSAPMLVRRASPLRLVMMLVGGQTLIHLALSVSAGHAGDRAVPAAARPHGELLGSLPVVDGRRVGSLQDAYAGGAGGSHEMAPAVPVGHLLNDLAAHAPMMAVHLAAAALVGLWLAYGERCLFAVLAMTGRRILLASWALPPIAALPSLSFARDRALPGPRSRWLIRPDARRGPPLLAV